MTHIGLLMILEIQYYVDKKGNVVTSFPASSFKVGVKLFGANVLGYGVDFFNPLSYAQDIVELFQNNVGNCE